jgi:hypothetical protein
MNIKQLMRVRKQAVVQGIRSVRDEPAELYKGDNPDLCNARTKSRHYCRSLALSSGRCKWHGGMSTGPRTSEGKVRSAMNLQKVRNVRAESHAHDKPDAPPHTKSWGPDKT